MISSKIFLCLFVHSIRRRTPVRRLLVTNAGIFKNQPKLLPTKVLSYMQKN